MTKKSLLRLMLEYIDILGENNGQRNSLVDSLVLLDRLRDKIATDELTRRIWRIWESIPFEQRQLIMVMDKWRRKKKENGKQEDSVKYKEEAVSYNGVFF